MDTINYTKFSSLLFRTGLENDHLAAAIMVRVLFDITAQGIQPAATQEWPLSIAPQESPYGPLESDAIFRRNGVDILIYGNARSLNEHPVKKMTVKTTIPDKLSHTIQIFGNRFWVKSIFGLTMSEPESFTEMPLNLKNAFGGKAAYDGLEIPYGNNAFGKGYYWDKEDASDKPLPNIESPEALIQKWNDSPDPAGVVNCPMNELRMRNNIIFDGKGKLKQFGSGYFNTAFPGMIAKEIIPGDRIQIDGVSPIGSWVFVVPDYKIKTKIQLGEKVIERRLAIDQIGLIPDKQQAFITFRYPFRYKFTPFQKRVCEIINDSENGIN